MYILLLLSWIYDNLYDDCIQYHITKTDDDDLCTVIETHNSFTSVIVHSEAF